MLSELPPDMSDDGSGGSGSSGELCLGGGYVWLFSAALAHV
jgi:hypothetical protein